MTASIERLVEQQNNLAKTDIRNNLEEYVDGTDDNEGIFTVLNGYRSKIIEAEAELSHLESEYHSILYGSGKKYFSNWFEYNN